MKRPGWKLSLLASLLVVLPWAAGAEETVVSLDGAEPIQLQADQISVNQGTSTYEATGGVRLTRGGMSLSAEHFWWQAETGEAGAKGSVRLTEAGGILIGDQLSLNLETGTARLRNARAEMSAQGFFLSGAELEKTGDRSFRLRDGAFTTCEGEPPVWRFAARDLQVDLGHYATARSVSFYLWDVPVFWFPYLLYPVKSERESGLLVPRFGYSRQRGNELSLAYYQVLARNMDSTVYLDYLSELGLGKGLEYRYLFGEDNLGTLHGYHISGFGSNDSSYALGWRHLGTLPGNVRLSADLEYVSSRSFFADFGETAEEYNKDITESVLTLGRNWGKLNLGGQFRYVQDLERSDAATLQRLPEARLALIRSRLGDGPFYYQFDAGADNYWRRRGERGQRYQLRPALAAVLQPRAALYLELEGGYRQYLFDSEREQTSAGVFDGALRLGSRLERVYPLEGRRLARLRHTLEPQLEYRYVADEDQVRLSTFDALGVEPARNLLRYGIVNRLTARWRAEGANPYQELLTLRLWQYYDVAAARRDGTASGSAQPFSPLYADLRLAPLAQLTLKLDAALDFNPGRQGLAEFGSQLAWTDGGGNSVGVDYLYRQNQVGYLTTEVATALLRPVYLHYRNRFDSQGGRSLEQVFDVEYRGQCWSIFLTYKDRLDDREYLVSFTLSGLNKPRGLGSGLRQASE